MCGYFAARRALAEVLRDQIERQEAQVFPVGVELRLP
jgi:hypothetical protein